MSPYVIGIGLIGGLGTYAVVGVLSARKILHGKVQEGHNDVVVPMFLTAGVIYAVLLGFMVIAVWETYDAAKSNAAAEAAALVPLYRTTSGMPKDIAEHMKHLTREYLEAVIEDEWPSQATTGKSSSKARKAIGDMFRAFGDGTITAQDKKDFPFILAAFMNSVTEITNLRNKRNIQANESLPTVMWVAAIGGALVIITMSFFPYMEKPGPHVAIVAIMSSLIGFLLFICFLMTHVFQGPLAIDAECFENAIGTLDDVDRGN